MEKMKESEGCGRSIKMNTTIGFVCGKEDESGKIRLCAECYNKQNGKNNKTL